MSNLKIVLCDDKRADGEDWAKAVEGATGTTPRRLFDNDLREALKAFFENTVSPALDDSGSGKGSDFDDFDIAIIDNALVKLNIGGLRPTAETIAGYIRAFSRCSYVVSLNKNPDVDFDLQFLIGDASTKADLAINADHLVSHWLWSRSSVDGEEFRPWYWPKLLAAPEQRRKQISSLGGCLDEKIVDFFGFSVIRLSLYRAQRAASFIQRAQTFQKSHLETSLYRQRLPYPRRKKRSYAEETTL